MLHKKWFVVKPPFLTAIVALFVLAALLMPGSCAVAQNATNSRVLSAVKDISQKLGCSIMVLGSWVSGKGYGDPLKGGASDHDMRLVLPKGTPPELAAEEWRNARNALEKTIRDEFGDKADEILKSTNFYPPSQLMNGVEKAEDAVERFKELNQVPGMSQTGKTVQITEDVTEGLYGKGSKTWTQNYELKRGKLVYSVPQKSAEGKTLNKVFTGAADMTHLEEGIAEYTSSGMGNTSKQWISHAEDFMSKGNGEKVAKYLERLERDLAKGRDLARLSAGGSWRDELRALTKELQDNPINLTQLEGRLQTVLSRAKTTAAIMSKIDNRSTTQRLVLGNLINAVDNSHDFASDVMKAAQKVPLDKVLDALMLYVSTVEVSRAAGARDPAGVMLGCADFMAPLPASLLAHLTNYCMDSTREAGYDMAAGSQQAFDLLAGIYTARGRENAEGKVYTIDQLAERYREGDEDKLRAFVRGLANLAADKQAGTANAVHDDAVAEDIFDECCPVIERAWRARREQWMMAILDYRDKYISKGIMLTYSPSPAIMPTDGSQMAITAKVDTLRGKPGEELAQVRGLLTRLYGKGKYFVDVEDTWKPTGRAGQSDWIRHFAYAQPGTYPVTVKRTINIGGTNIPSDSPLVSTKTMLASVDIEVQGTPKKKPQAVKNKSKVSPLLAKLQQMKNLTCGISVDDYRSGYGASFPEAIFDGPKPIITLTWNGTHFTYSYRSNKSSQYNGTSAKDGKQITVQGTQNVTSICNISGEVSPNGRMIKTLSISAKYSDISPSAEYITSRSATLRNIPFKEINADSGGIAFSVPQKQIHSSMVSTSCHSSGYQTMFESKYIEENHSQVKYYFTTKVPLPSLSGPIAPVDKVISLTVGFGKE